MRILFVNATLDPVWGGGASERTRRLSAAMARMGHRVTILTIDLGLSDSRTSEIEGVEVVSLGCLNQRFAFPELPITRLRQLIDRQDFVLLTAHWTILNAMVYILARIANKPYAVNPAGSLPRFGRSPILKSAYNFFLGRAIIRNADVRIAIAPTEIPQFAEYGVTAEGVVVIPNGIDAESFVPADPLPFRARHGLDDLPLILFMGRLNSIKGPDLLLEAFVQIASRFPSYQLVFAGPNEGMETTLRSFAQSHGVADRVRFVGYVGKDEKTAAYRSATLLAIPSRKEAMSIVVLEGGAAGIPVLITDQCGFDDVQRIGGGRVVKAEAVAIAEGLATMLDNAQELPDSGRRLCELVRNDFTWDAAATRLSAAMGKAVEQRQECMKGSK
ncbi:MAG: glycosyltransferase [Gemmatimonadota bacterium]|nr:glycosyltransferase [Gemmatimonadota bacterium]